MPKRWSKLQSRLYSLMDPAIHFQLHCALYEMNSNDGHHANKLPRCFITVGKEIVFDYPRDFDTTRKYGRNSYPWDTEICEISNMIEAYIQRPEADLMQPFEGDVWGLTDLLRVCDRRVGKRRLRQLQDSTTSQPLLHIIGRRLEGCVQTPVSLQRPVRHKIEPHTSSAGN